MATKQPIVLVRAVVLARDDSESTQTCKACEFLDRFEDNPAYPSTVVTICDKPAEAECPNTRRAIDRGVQQLRWSNTTIAISLILIIITALFIVLLFAKI